MSTGDRLFAASAISLILSIGLLAARGADAADLSGKRSLLISPLCPDGTPPPCRVISRKKLAIVPTKCSDGTPPPCRATILRKKAHIK
jgi:hypothetical protein